MTPEELQEYMRSLQGRYAPKPQTKPAPAQQPLQDSVDLDPAIAHARARKHELSRQAADSYIDLNTPRPDFDPIKGPLEYGDTASAADVVAWDPEEAERLGMGELAGQLRKMRGTAQTTEKGPVEASRLVQLPMQKSYGRFGTNPKMVEQELTYLNIKTYLHRKGVKNFYDLPTEEQEAVKQIAAERAKRKVAGIIGEQEQRGNVVVDIDPEGTIDKIKRGETLAGVMSGQYLGSRVEGLLRGIKPEDTVYSKVFSPFTALTLAGGRSIEAQTERPILGMQKESKLSWFFRLAPSTVIGSWLFSDEPMEWGSEDHIRRVYAEGYDLTREIPRFGEAYAAATPWVDSEIAKKVAGFGMMLPIILVEPDPTMLIAGPLGKGAKAVAKSASPSRLLAKTVLRPELARWSRMLDEAGESGVVDLSAFERSLGLREWSPKWLMWRSAKADFLAQAAAEGIPVWGQKASSDLKYLDDAAKEASRIRGKAGEDLVDAGAEAQSATRTGKMFDADVQPAADALQQSVDTGRLVAAVRALKDRRDGWINWIEQAAASRGLKTEAADFAARLRQGGQEAAAAFSEVAKAKRAYDRKAARLKQLSALARGHRPLSKREAQELVQLSADAHKYRSTLVAALPDAALNNGLSNLRMFNDALDQAVQKVSVILNKPADKITGELGQVIQESAAATAAARTFLQDALGASRAAAVDTRAAMATLRETAAEYQRRKGIELLAKNPAPLMKRVLEKYGRAADAVESAFAAGERLEQRAFQYAGSLTQQIRGTNAGPTAFLAKIAERYGDDAMQHAVAVTPGASVALTSGRKIVDQDIAQLRRLEEAAHQYLESGRLASMAPVQQILETTTQIPSWGRHFTLEGWLASTMRMTRLMGRVFDPILSRGLAGSPEAVKNLYRKSFERFNSYTTEMDGFMAYAKSRGADPIAAAMEYLTKPTRRLVGGAVTVANRDSLLPAEKALRYLRAVLKAGDEAWDSDLAVRALGWSALPTKQRAESGAAAGVQRLKAVVEASTDGADFLKRVQGDVERAIARKELAVDASQVTARFVLRGAVWAATMHDAMWDALRIQGGGVSIDAANALNFMTDARKAGVLGKAVRSTDMDELARITSAYNLPLSQEVASGKVDSFRVMLGGVREKNELIKAAELEGMGVWLPGHIKKALDDIPSRLTKEIEQFHTPGNPVSAVRDKMLRLWRVGAVNGWILPRPAHFVNTFLGDFSQLTASVGWRPAARISAQTAVAYIPLVGTRLQDQISRAALGKSMATALFNPDLSRVMRGGSDIIETADGPITARRMLQEAHEHGMLDSISTADLMEVTSRVGRSRWAGVLTLDRPLPWIERWAKALEAVQHRIRVQTFLEARTGRLTGTPLPAEEAAKLTREALFDWRLGVPKWESESIGRVAAFWTYKRAMLRQLGASLTEAYTTPGRDYFWRAMTGRTKMARIRQLGQLTSAIPETIYWTDPDQLLTDDEQIIEYGRRVAPWWVVAEPILANRELTGARKEWYSEVRGKNVTMESLIGPALTTMDAVASMTLVANTVLASSVMLAEQAGLEPRLTTVGAGKLWEQNIDALGDTLAPGYGEILTNAMRPVFGRPPRGASTRGRTVPTTMAVTITGLEAHTMRTLGWGDFLGTYKDKDGKLRYHADPTALQMIGRIIASSPPGSELAKNWVNAFDNPGYRQSVGTGILEAFARVGGFVRYADLSPLESAEWETVNKENELKELLKRAQAQSGKR